MYGMNGCHSLLTNKHLTNKVHQGRCLREELCHHKSYGMEMPCQLPCPLIKVLDSEDSVEESWLKTRPASRSFEKSRMTASV
jgi:hypothetical protein